MLLPYQGSPAVPTGELCFYKAHPDGQSPSVLKSEAAAAAADAVAVYTSL